MGVAELAESGQKSQSVGETRRDDFIQEALKFLIGDDRAVGFACTEEKLRPVPKFADIPRIAGRIEFGEQRRLTCCRHDCPTEDKEQNNHVVEKILFHDVNPPVLLGFGFVHSQNTTWSPRLRMK